MEIKNKFEKKDSICASIDQLSCVNTKLWQGCANIGKTFSELLIPSEVTQSSVERGIDFVNKVLKPAGFARVGLSVRGGLMTDIGKARNIIDDNESSRVYFSSGDMPIRNWWNAKHYVEDLTVEEKWPPSFSQLFAWRLHNVGSVKLLQNKFRQLQRNTNFIEGKKLIRWDIYGIRDDANRIIPLMDQDTALAIEYYPRYGKPEDFFNKIDSLKNKYKKKEIGISFDPVYYYMAAKLYKGILSPYDYFKKILNERPDQLMMLEVNQMAEGSIKPHTAYTDGKLNFYKMFYEYGKNIRSLNYIPHFAYEPHPKYYEQVMAEGVEYFTKLNNSFLGDDRYCIEEEKDGKTRG